MGTVPKNSKKNLGQTMKSGMTRHCFERKSVWRVGKMIGTSRDGILNPVVVVMVSIIKIAIIQTNG
jgi:hypothetical protein